MLEKLKSYWNYGTTYCSIELTSTSEGERMFAITAKKKKGEYEDLYFNEAETISEIQGFIKKNQHAFLTINTNQVLVKETNLLVDPQMLLSQTFPGLNYSEFYYEIVKSGSKAFVAVCRKEYVEKIINEFENHNISIIGFQLGFSSLEKLIPILKVSSVNTGRFHFALANKHIESFTEASAQGEVYHIENIEVPSNYLVAVSGLLKYDAGSEIDSINFSTDNKGQTEKYREKNFFRKAIVVGVVTLLVLLLINFLVFDSYYKNYQILQEESELSKTQRERYTIKQHSVTEKEKLVSNILNSGSSKSSYYINRLVAIKPTSILFDQVQYQPLSKTIRPDKSITYEKDIIIVSGKSNDKEVFSSWIELIEKLDWTSSVIIKNYGASTSKVSEFSLQITVADDSKE